MSPTPSITDHSRRFADNRFVYPVLSRRSQGLSIGVNLNPDKVCNFDCIYCQVDRTTQSDTRFVEWETLLSELNEFLARAQDGSIWNLPVISDVPPHLRHVNDIAFSGDGEPTTYENFDEIIAACAERKRYYGLTAVKMVLITNASRFHRPHVIRGLELLDQNQGEIWAKLDAGTADYFKRIDRTSIPFQHILDNLSAAAKLRPLVMQSLFMKVADEPPSESELQAYCERLLEILDAGGRIQLVQVYTIARRPAESYVAPLSDSQVDAIVDLVKQRTGLAAKAFYGHLS